MDVSKSAVFEVYLRLRPRFSGTSEQFIHIDEPTSSTRTSITIKPPVDDYRKRPVEKFCFTRVFDEQASQTDVFNDTSILPLIEGVLAPEARPGRDGLLATLGVTGSGKSHTILGTRSQRGLTQMTLDVLFQSTQGRLAVPSFAIHELAASDVTNANLACASSFLDHIYGTGDSRASSRAQTPLTVSSQYETHPYPNTPMGLYKSLSSRRRRISPSLDHTSISESAGYNMPSPAIIPAPATGIARITGSLAKLRHSPNKELPPTGLYIPSIPATPSSKRHRPAPTALPQVPRLDEVVVAADRSAEYAIVVSMYEIYNDQIFDLLTDPAAGIATRMPFKELRRRPLLFKSTEQSPDRKVVAGLKKIVCGTLEEALLVLETGLAERTVAGTGSNATSSRSHGFFCVEVKKRATSVRGGLWKGSTLTIVDMAGTERARTAKTAGTTLAEAGKINESLMWLGQYMQFQLDKNPPAVSASTLSNEIQPHATMGPSPTPSSTSAAATATNSKIQQAIRRCKLTELLFTNSSTGQVPAQKSVMIVTADPRGDFNATSQMLRYSALAREVTQPRIPSVSSIVGWNTGRETGNSSSRPQTATSEDRETAEAVIRLEQELRTERERREAAEIRLDTLEANIRQECWDAFEARLQTERERWVNALEDAMEAGERHVDAKVGIVSRGFEIHEDEEADGGVGLGGSGMVNRAAGRVEELEREVDDLREQLNGLKRQRDVGRTPSKKVKVLKARKWNLESDSEGVGLGIEPGNENADPYF